MTSERLPPDRVGVLREKLQKLHDARTLREDSAWAGAWDALESALLSTLMETGAGADADREREHLTISLRIAKRMRALMECRGESVSEVEKELDMLEGRKLRPVA